MSIVDKIFNWYFKKRSLPYWCILILDCIIVYMASFFVYWIIHRGSVTQLHFYTITNAMWIYLIISVCAYKLFNTYTGIIRYSSFADLKRVAFANFTALTISIAVHYAINLLPVQKFEHLNARHLIITFMMATAMQWGVRILIKIIYDVVSNNNSKAPNVLIYGIHDGGVALAKGIRSQRPVRFILNGFISPEPVSPHFILMDKKVCHSLEKVRQTIEMGNIEAVLVSPTRKKEFRANQALQDLLISLGVKIFMVEQSFNENDTPNADSAMSLKEVDVEDLLPRDEISVDMESVGRELTGKRILITGCAGSIGSEIVRQVAAYKPQSLILIDQAESPEHDIRLMMNREYPDIDTHTIVTTICNQSRMENIFHEFKPEYIFHAAAYKHVPMMEDNPSEAVTNNIYGTKVIADLSVKYHARKFVMVSTDKAVNPTNVMGCSKRICEIYVQALYQKLQKAHKDGENTTEFITTRFGNVLGSNGSVIPLFREQIKKGGPVTVTDPDIIRFFMLIPEACKLVLEAGTKGNGGEIFVFDMGQPVKIADLAKRMIQLSGAKNVEIKYTGLREGEKLYEEVLNDKENTKPTFHEKIRIASVREYDFDLVSKEIDDLIQTAYNYDDMATVKKMKLIVPEFKSNNSKYEVLDK